MKPAIVSHHDYKSSLRKRLDAIYPDKSRIPKNIGIIYRKFRDLDLSEVDRMMQPKYSHVGPKPWSPSFLLRALLVAIAFKCTSITNKVGRAAQGFTDPGNYLWFCTRSYSMRWDLL